MKKGIRVLTSIIVLVSFIISIAVFFAFYNKKTERILFFMEQAGRKTAGESRWVPGYRYREKNIEIFISELLLGPAGLNYVSVLPAGAKVEKILLRNNILYLDLNHKAIIFDSKIYFPFNISRDLIKKNIKFNFPYVKKIIITVNGEEPDQGETGEFRSGI